MLPTPSVSGNRIKLSPSGYLKVGIAAILIFTAIVLYVFEFNHFDKTIDIKYLLILSLVLGLIAGVLIGRRLAKEEHEIFEQMRIYMICATLCIVFMPLLVSLTNRLLDFKTPIDTEAQILSFQPQTDLPFGHMKGEKVDITHYEWVLLIDGKNFKFSTKELPFPENELGDLVSIPVHRGLLGIRYLSYR